MDSFSKYLKYKTKYLNLLNKMLQNGGYNCPKCLSMMSPKALKCDNCGQKQSALLDIKDEPSAEPQVVPVQGALLDIKDEPSAEEIQKIKEKRMKMTERLLSNSKLSITEPKDVLDFQEITELDQPESVVNIMAYAGENPEELYIRLSKTMKIFENDEDKFKKDLEFNITSPYGYTYVSLLEDGFAIGMALWAKNCDFVWFKFIADKKLSLFIIANCIIIEKTKGRTSFPNYYCPTSAFLYGKYRCDIVNSGFKNDLPDGMVRILKHPVVLYAAKLGRLSGDSFIHDWIEDRKKNKDDEGYTYHKSINY